MADDEPPDVVHDPLPADFPVDFFLKLIFTDQTKAMRVSQTTTLGEAIANGFEKLNVQGGFSGIDPGSLCLNSLGRTPEVIGVDCDKVPPTELLVNLRYVRECLHKGPKVPVEFVLLSKTQPIQSLATKLSIEKHSRVTIREEVRVVNFVMDDTESDRRRRQAEESEAAAIAQIQAAEAADAAAIADKQAQLKLLDERRKARIEQMEMDRLKKEAAREALRAQLATINERLVEEAKLRVKNKSADVAIPVPKASWSPEMAAAMQVTWVRLGLLTPARHPPSAAPADYRAAWTATHLVLEQKAPRMPDTTIYNPPNGIPNFEKLVKIKHNAAALLKT
jgi:hypothetical protein